MRQIKQYASKDEIYEDYSIAVRLVLERDNNFNISLYDKLPLISEDALKIERYSQWVEGFRTQYPLSAGFCVEVPLRGDTGQQYDTRFVLLGHETGAEIFLPLVYSSVVSGIGAAGTWAGLQTAGLLFKKIIEPGLDRIILECKQRLYGGIRIDRVEIRTADKGVLTLPFSKFAYGQLECIVQHFDSINDLSEVVDTCFPGVSDKVSFSAKQISPTG